MSAYIWPFCLIVMRLFYGLCANEVVIVLQSLAYANNVKTAAI